MHLLFLIPELDDGGPAKVFLTLINNIYHDDIKISLGVTKKSGKYFNQLRSNINIYKLRDSRYPIFSLAKLINKIKPNIVIATLRMDITACIASLISTYNFKLILRPANFIPLQMLELKNKKPIKHFFTEFIIRILFLKADFFIAQSIDIKKLLISYKIPKNKIKVIGNPISVDSVSKQAKIESIHFHKKKIGNPQIISLGRLMHQKGFDVLIESINLLKDKYPKLNLTIFGEGPERGKLEKIIYKNKLEKFISLPGKTHYPYAALAQADLFICSSRFEGFSNSLLEAMALGVQSISVDSPGSAREIIQNKINGYLVESLSKEKIAKQIGINSRKYVDENFSVIKITNSYLDAFDKVMNIKQ